MFKMIKKIIRKITKKINFYINLENKLFILENENLSIEKELSKLTEAYNLLDKKNYIVERDLFSAYKTLEYKFWEFNSATNKLLYDLELKSKKQKKNFNPKVSIIIPVYNGSDYLEQAINSALNQTYSNIEIIVVNDGSIDNNKSEKIAMKFKTKINYFKKENGGVSSALNYGISKMTGDYFAWLSHDDLIEKNHIEKLVEYISYNYNQKIIPFSSFKIIDENGLIKLNETIISQLHCFDYKISTLKNEYSLLQGEINGGSVLIPREAFVKYGGFNEEQKITQERDMWARLIKEYKFINIPHDTSLIRSHSKQVTNTNPRIKIETDEKNLEIIKQLSSEVKCRLEGDETSFYLVMKKFYENNNNKYMQEEMEKLININNTEKK